jgi:hypothetical protein
MLSAVSFGIDFFSHGATFLLMIRMMRFDDIDAQLFSGQIMLQYVVLCHQDQHKLT